MRNICLTVLASLIIFSCNNTETGQEDQPAIMMSALSQEARNQQAMVSAAHPLATRAGIEILEKGGNAVDAAVASAYALSVVEPSMSGLGGRLQAIVHLPDGQVKGVDATTQAPLSYDAQTAPKGRYGYATIGIPGVVAGLDKLLTDYGSLPRQIIMEPAIRYAEQGFELLPMEAARQAGALDELMEFEGSRHYFIISDSLSREAGSLFVQTDMANTLRAIAAGGADAFYRGDIARQIVEDIQTNGGVLSRENLAAYEAKDADILSSSYRGHQVYALSMPSYGAITLEIMNILENMPMQDVSEAEWAENMYRAIERAYEDRSKQYADSIDVLISKDYAAQVAEELMQEEVSAYHKPDAFTIPEAWMADQGHTTHLSAADSSGMMIALTQSLGPSMGSKVATPGLGFLYAVTLGGYLGEFEPGQRAASHISPIILTKENQPFMALGAAGGSRIISAITSVSSRVIDRDVPLYDALAAPRVHPDDADSVYVETHAGLEWENEALQAMQDAGLLLKPVDEEARFGRVHAVKYDPASGQWVGAADPDWEGAAAGPVE